MTVKEIAEKLRLTVYNMANECNAEGVWCGDLLSHVMVNAPEKCAWITVMTNVNVAAVAKLRKVSCVILCCGVTPDDELLEKAKSEGVTLLGTVEDACTVAKMI